MDVSEITIGGNIYAIKDAVARSMIQSLMAVGTTRFIGVTADGIFDLSNKNSLTIRDVKGSFSIVYDYNCPIGKEQPNYRSLRNGDVMINLNDNCQYVFLVDDFDPKNIMFAWHLIGK